MPTAHAVRDIFAPGVLDFRFVSAKAAQRWVVTVRLCRSRKDHSLCIGLAGIGRLQTTWLLLIGAVRCVARGAFNSLDGPPQSICWVYPYEGKLAEQGAPGEIFGAPKNERIRQFLSAILEAN